MIQSTACAGFVSITGHLVKSSSIRMRTDPFYPIKKGSPFEIEVALFNGNFEWVKEGIIKGEIDPSMTFNGSLEFLSKIDVYRAVNFTQKTIELFTGSKGHYLFLKDQFSTPNLRGRSIFEPFRESEKRSEIMEMYSRIISCTDEVIDLLISDLPLIKKEIFLTPIFLEINSLDQKEQVLVFGNEIGAVEDISLSECLSAIGQDVLADFVSERANSLEKPSLTIIVDDLKSPKATNTTSVKEFLTGKDW